MPHHLLDKLISKINHQNYSTIYWHEFLNSLTEEGINREIVADAQIFGFGVKQLEFVD